MIREFFKPQTIAEAVELKEKFEDEAVFMAGGTDLNCRGTAAAVEMVIGIEQLKLTKIANLQSTLFNHERKAIKWRKDFTTRFSIAGT